MPKFARSIFKATSFIGDLMFRAGSESRVAHSSGSALSVPGPAKPGSRCSAGSRMTGGWTPG